MSWKGWANVLKKEATKPLPFRFLGMSPNNQSCFLKHCQPHKNASEWMYGETPWRTIIPLTIKNPSSEDQAVCSPLSPFFGLAFIGSLVDTKSNNNPIGIALTFFITVFLLLKYLFPSPFSKPQKPSNYSLSSYDNYNDDPYTSDDMDDIFNEWENGNR